MVFYVIIPLVLSLVVLYCALAVYYRMRDTLPSFEKGAFLRSESRLLRVFEGLLDTDTANKLDAQVRYFIDHGKYWRYDDENANGVELCEGDTHPLDREACFGFQEECALAVISFELKGKSHEVIFQAANGRLWGWRVSPPLPRNIRNRQLQIKAAQLLDHSELAVNTDEPTRDFPVQKLNKLSVSFIGRPS